MSYVCASWVAIVCGVRPNRIPDWKSTAPVGVIEGLYRTGSSISMWTRDVFNHTIKKNQWQYFLVEVFLDLSLVVSWLSWVCHVCSKPKPINLNFNQADDHETKDVPNYHCWTCNSYRNHPPCGFFFILVLWRSLHWRCRKGEAMHCGGVHQEEEQSWYCLSDGIIHKKWTGIIYTPWN